VSQLKEHSNQSASDLRSQISDLRRARVQETIPPAFMPVVIQFQPTKIQIFLGRAAKPCEGMNAAMVGKTKPSPV